ncbi:hypothetical protein JS533_004090 [Bifidobacterium amazonense]|uniref:Uncharacterized protein n=1 Tax=Bifidobacterium amazonense TaxID=2809027 RepID=A0ABS9VU32_9BIFI|nr:hypothetical protein [Bifidobacterium amazonense]MCH9275456.1 hypothetical protein [Bifidobacterium amazonense]
MANAKGVFGVGLWREPLIARQTLTQKRAEALVCGESHLLPVSGQRKRGVERWFVAGAAHQTLTPKRIEELVYGENHVPLVRSQRKRSIWRWSLAKTFG